MNNISRYLENINEENLLKFRLLLKNNSKGLIINITEENTFFFVIKKRSDERYILTKSAYFYPIGYNDIRKFKIQKKWSNRENNQYFAKYFTKEYLERMEVLNYEWINLDFVYVLSSIPCSFLGKYIEEEKGVKFIKNINLNSRQIEILSSLASDDYQNRNGGFPKSNIPISIQVVSYNSFIKVKCSFKNTNKEISKNWLYEKLSSFNISEDSYIISVNQIGDYNNDWVDVKATIVL